MSQLGWQKLAHLLLVCFVSLSSMGAGWLDKAAPESYSYQNTLAAASEWPLDPGRIQFTPVASGLVQPLDIFNAGDGSGRIFIVERAGLIRILKNGSLLATPFLDMRSIVDSSSGERGLLSLVFHPQYTTNGYFYTLHTNASGSIVLSRFTASPVNSDQANFNSRVELLVIPHPTYANHNGGTLAFGPDHYLYWSTGDGGGTGDPFNNAQNLTSLLGKILRLDVDSASPYAIPPSNPFVNNPDPSVRKEIWAYGLRNPWRFSFDRLTHDMYIGDVGQSTREEIDFQPAGSPGGQNYGWDVMEGSICYNATTCNTANKVLPVAEYAHPTGCSVTGGYVYRGASYPSLYGHYLYADFCTGLLFDLHPLQGGGWANTQLLDTTYGISTFGEDENGELYLADYNQGTIYKIAYDETTFYDVPSSDPFRSYIETVYKNGITGGCRLSPLMYCPNAQVTRDQIAVFLLRGIHASSYAPPPATGVFQDVSTNYWAADWIEELAAERITSGCREAPKQYCPSTALTRDQMAIFLLRARHGPDYVPPKATGVFQDVPTNYWAADWIERLAAEGITSGCSTAPKLYCPAQPVTRAEMAVLLVKTFNLQ